MINETCDRGKRVVVRQELGGILDAAIVGPSRDEVKMNGPLLEVCHHRGV
jgi:hypothetical protein